ncbi:MAG: type I restriction-modification system subunit M [Bacilli bacterium]
MSVEQTQQTQQNQQTQLHSQLWSMANDLRGNMDANEFKNYILGLIFYRYLSENLVDYANRVLLKDDNMNYCDAWKNKNYQEGLKEELINDSNIGYFIEPVYLWVTLIDKIKTGKFDVTILSKAINSISDSTLGNESEDDFENLFADMDLNSSRLGKGEADRTKLIEKIMLKINDIDFHHEDAEIDVLGDAYEYLIGNFAASSGKKAGEFYTPQQVSKILAKVVSLNKSTLKKLYDPTCGSGSLLLRVGKETKVSTYYGQEFNSTTYNLARMNMLLHGISFKHFDIKNDDTLEHPQHLDLKFDAIVANPPYSANWSSDQKFLDDERFSAYGRLAPKSKADYAFIQHMIYQLADNGTMAVVLPHGVLFRGAAEGTIREYLIKEKNYLDTVIGLPANIFFGTSIPTCILVFKKCREYENNILFIDASKDYEAGKNQNRLRDEDVDKILETYKNRQELEKYSHIASLEEIKENDYNLNIPRYVDTFEEEEEIDIKEVQKQLREIDKEIAETDKELNKYLKELGLDEI